MTELEEFLEAVTKDDIKDYKPTIEGENTYTILDKLNAVLLWLKEHPDMVGTVVRIAGENQKAIDFTADPQLQIRQLRSTLTDVDVKVNANTQGVTRLDGEVDRIDALVDALDATKADASTVATKQEYFTYKYEGEFTVTDINDFRTKIYEQRKNTVRRWQLEINPYNLDLMSVLGYPDDGISTADKAFLYVEVPYSEAGGFEIDLKLMKRDGSRIFTRVMASTLDSNWNDTGWINIEAVNDKANLGTNGRIKPEELYTSIKDLGSGTAIITIPQKYCKIDAMQNIGYIEVNGNRMTTTGGLYTFVRRFDTLYCMGITKAGAQYFKAITVPLTPLEFKSVSTYGVAYINEEGLL